MDYIEIAEGLSVRIDEIEAIGYGEEELKSKVYTHHNIYNSILPYKVLLELLEREQQQKKNIEEKEFNILKEVGTFAG